MINGYGKVSALGLRMAVGLLSAMAFACADERAAVPADPFELDEVEEVDDETPAPRLPLHSCSIECNGIDCVVDARMTRAVVTPRFELSPVASSELRLSAPHFSTSIAGPNHNGRPYFVLAGTYFATANAKYEPQDVRGHEIWRRSSMRFDGNGIHNVELELDPDMAEVQLVAPSSETYRACLKLEDASVEQQIKVYVYDGRSRYSLPSGTWRASVSRGCTPRYEKVELSPRLEIEQGSIIELPELVRIPRTEPEPEPGVDQGTRHFVRFRPFLNGERLGNPSHRWARMVAHPHDARFDSFDFQFRTDEMELVALAFPEGVWDFEIISEQQRVIVANDVELYGDIELVLDDQRVPVFGDVMASGKSLSEYAERPEAKLIFERTQTDVVHTTLDYESFVNASPGEILLATGEYEVTLVLNGTSTSLGAVLVDGRELIFETDVVYVRLGEIEFDDAWSSELRGDTRFGLHTASNVRVDGLTEVRKLVPAMDFDTLYISFGTLAAQERGPRWALQSRAWLACSDHDRRRNR